MKGAVSKHGKRCILRRGMAETELSEVGNLATTVGTTMSSVSPRRPQTERADQRETCSGTTWPQ
jgi:hypothetical protein